MTFSTQLREKGTVVFIFLLILISQFNVSFSQELLIRNETFTITKESDPIYDGNAFHTWEDMSELPDNWKSPVNYYDGKIYVRYQILEQPKVDMDGDGTKEYTRKTRLQFVFWQTQAVSGTETAGDHVEMTGPGTVGEASSVLSTWWVKNPPIDFTNVRNFQKMGLAVWDGESSCLPSTWEEALGNHPNNCKQVDNAKTFKAWNENGETQDVPYQDYFFPMKIRIIVVAVPQGATFSGWDNYLAEPNAPYTVDYANEKTNETVSSAWEYAGSTLGPWVAGASSKVNLTPGANKYFRKVIDPSYVKTLKVSTRPAAPAVSVNFTNETTVSAIPSTMEYSTNSGMTGAIAGTGAVIPVTPGSALYFRNKATVSAFSSEIYNLNVAARPSAPLVGIDFINEKTDIAIPATMEYANNQDFTGSASGTAINLDIVPGSTLYFRNKATANAFKSEIKTLVAPARPDAPAYSVDFLNESTNVVVPASDEYASTSDMAGAIAGSGAKLTLTPGNNIFLRTKASGTFFKSQVQELTVPVRPAAPTYTINFANETTQQDVSSNDEYDTDASMLNAAAGQGSKIPVTPGSTFYFRKKATNLNFRSVNSILTAPSRPAAPLFTIDYSKVTTVENVPASVIYSKNSNFSSSNDGAGVSVALDPGSSLYFKSKATSNAFASEMSTLNIPARPASPSYGIDYVVEKTNALVPVTVEFSENANFSPSTNGTNAQLSLTPGKTLYFRIKSTSNKFSSLPYTLEIPARPAAPAFGIDFSNERTSSAVDNSFEYSTSETFANTQNGPNASLTLTPGTNLHFRKKYTNTSFYGLTQTLVVPARPSITSSVADTTKESLVSLNITFPTSVSGFMASDIRITNGLLKSILGSYTIQVAPVNTGYVSVNIDANVVSEGNFKADQFRFYYDKNTGFRDLKLQGVSIFPNPSRGSLNITTSGLKGETTVVITTLQGSKVYESIFESTEETLHLDYLPKGLFLVKVTNNGLSTVEKLILE